MRNIRILVTTSVLGSIFWLAGCASTPAYSAKPSAAAPAAADAAVSEKANDPKWEVATEAEVASKLDREVAKAAKSYVQLKKDGVLMFCKRYRSIGSNIPTIKCITEAQLREDVENMATYRDDMRNKMGKCTLGANGGGAAPCGAGQ